MADAKEAGKKKMNDAKEAGKKFWLDTKSAYVKAKQLKPADVVRAVKGLPAQAKEKYKKATLADVTPEERESAMRLAESELWTKREVESLLICYNRIRKKDGHHSKVVEWRDRHPTVADFHRYYRLDATSFTTQILLLPKEIGIEGIAPEDVEKMELTFVEYALSVWILCSFELSTLAFSMMDTEQIGTLSRAQVREAVARTYSIHAVGRRGFDLNGTLKLDGTKSVDSKLKRVMEGLDTLKSGKVSREEFVAFSHRYHYMLLPAFGVQRAVRDRTFGKTIRWAHHERNKNRMSQGRTIQAIVKEVALVIPELAAAQRSVPVGTYRNPASAMTHAAEAYRRGDYETARAAYEHYDTTDFSAMGDNVHQNPDMFGLAMDGKAAARQMSLKRRTSLDHGPSVPINTDERPFGGTRFVDSRSSTFGQNRAHPLGEPPGEPPR